MAECARIISANTSPMLISSIQQLDHPRRRRPPLAADVASLLVLALERGIVPTAVPRSRRLRPARLPVRPTWSADFQPAYHRPHACWWWQTPWSRSWAGWKPALPADTSRRAKGGAPPLSPPPRPFKVRRLPWSFTAGSRLTIMRRTRARLPIATIRAALATLHGLRRSVGAARSAPSSTCSRGYSGPRRRSKTRCSPRSAPPPSRTGRRRAGARAGGTATSGRWPRRDPRPCATTPTTARAPGRWPPACAPASLACWAPTSTAATTGWRSRTSAAGRTCGATCTSSRTPTPTTRRSAPGPQTGARSTIGRRSGCAGRPPRHGRNARRCTELEDRAHARGLRHAGVAHKGHPCHALCHRLLRHQRALFQFVRVPGLAADNNLAERAIRPRAGAQDQRRHA